MIEIYKSNISQKYKTTSQMGRGKIKKPGSGLVPGFINGYPPRA
jgi:hypothetical protein